MSGRFLLCSEESDFICKCGTPIQKHGMSFHTSPVVWWSYLGRDSSVTIARSMNVCVITHNYTYNTELNICLRPSTGYNDSLAGSRREEGQHTPGTCPHTPPHRLLRRKGREGRGMGRRRPRGQPQAQHRLTGVSWRGKLGCHLRTLEPAGCLCFLLFTAGMRNYAYICVMRNYA